MESCLQHLAETINPHPLQTIKIYDLPPNIPRYNVNHEFFAHWLKNRRGTVVTTNFDCLIEQAWKHINPPSDAPLWVIKKPEEFQDWLSIVTSTASAIWKLHGSAEDPSSWAVTLNTVTFDLRDDARGAFLQHIGANHHLCFTAYVN